MNSKTVKPKPIYFSDYFKVDKTKLKELGVFDPILNFDTKLFVDPILLKSSTLSDFEDTFIELEDFDWQFDENYTNEKRRGGQQRHRQTTEIKEELIQPMFYNRTLIKGQSVKQRAKKINGELSQIPTMSETNIELFSKKIWCANISS